MFFIEGLLSVSWWGYVLYALLVTHITIVAVTVYLHRCQAHRSVDLHPIIAHFFRFWLWLTTGMGTKDWVSIHRKHHAKVETKDDPHSPLYHGSSKVLWEGAELYRQESANAQTIEDYGHQTPDDFIERHIYSCRPNCGISLMLAFNVSLFGFMGVTIWAVQMAWIPFFAAGVINGMAHWRGYRNFLTDDTSTNLTPWGILIGGEELHNNHHAFASSAKFSYHPWEFDIGWLYIRIMEFLGLAKVKKIFPQLSLQAGKDSVDEQTLDAVLVNQVHVMAAYRHQVFKPICKEYSENGRSPYRKLRRLLMHTERFHDETKKRQLAELLRDYGNLKEVYEYSQRLHALWMEREASKEILLKALQEWCQQAEQSGIDVLKRFAEYLRSYAVIQPIATT
ncbi:MAG: DesA family fatty acid desaturase [Candidatus Eutrophobiaceae bacterium]